MFDILLYTCGSKSHLNINSRFNVDCKTTQDILVTWQHYPWFFLFPSRDLDVHFIEMEGRDLSILSRGAQGFWGNQGTAAWPKQRQRRHQISILLEKGILLLRVIHFDPSWSLCHKCFVSLLRLDWLHYFTENRLFSSWKQPNFKGNLCCFNPRLSLFQSLQISFFKSSTLWVDPAGRDQLPVEWTETGQLVALLSRLQLLCLHPLLEK